MSANPPSKGQAIGQIVVDAVSTALPVVGTVLNLLGLGNKKDDDKAKKKDIEAAIEQERKERLAEAQTKLKPMLDVSIELATLNAFLKPAISGQERVREMLGILSVNPQPTDAIWTALKNEWDLVAPVLKKFADVSDDSLSKVRNVMLRMNLTDLQGINNEAGIQIGQFFTARDAGALNDGLKDVSKLLQLLFKVVSTEISNLQAEIEAISSFVSPKPAPPVAELAIAMVDESPLTAEHEELEEEVKALRDKYSQWCFAWYGKIDGSDGLKSLGVLDKAAKWTPGEEITVSFLDGDPELQKRVQRVAEEWVTKAADGNPMANLRLTFLKNTNDTNVRISFKYRGSWSMVGTTCRTNTDLKSPTMNFGWLTPDSTEQSLRRVVLHEFGHVMGLHHEHINPNGKIEWNRDAVIRDLSGPPNSWSLDVINRNMFDAPKDLVTTPLDAHSIMMYPIPTTWLMSGTPIGLNSELSDTDKNFIRQQYP